MKKHEILSNGTIVSCFGENARIVGNDLDNCDIDEYGNIADLNYYVKYLNSDDEVIDWYDCMAHYKDVEERVFTKNDIALLLEIQITNEEEFKRISSEKEFDSFEYASFMEIVYEEAKIAFSKNFQFNYYTEMFNDTKTMESVVKRSLDIIAKYKSD